MTSETGGLKVASTIILVLQVNRPTKSASQIKSIFHQFLWAFIETNKENIF